MKRQQGFACRAGESWRDRVIGDLTGLGKEDMPVRSKGRPSIGAYLPVGAQNRRSKSLVRFPF